MNNLDIFLFLSPFILLYAYFFGLFFSKVKKIHTGLIEWICVLFYLRVEIGVHKIRMLLTK